jgi:hypothetical protein
MRGAGLLLHAGMYDLGLRGSDLRDQAGSKNGRNARRQAQSRHRPVSRFLHDRMYSASAATSLYRREEFCRRG